MFTMNFNDFAMLMLAAPLVGAATVGLNSRRISDRLSHFITCLLLFISALCATAIFKYVAIDKNVIHIKLFQWIASGSLNAYWSIYIDTLTAVMLVVVTYVSALVHLYSVGYMHHDKHQPRFMSYLSLFTFCMLMLVTSDNFAQLFFGWEGVGVCSYLLIGFWYKKPSANAAAMKAFLVNRVGDFGFALGIFVLYWYCNSITYSEVFAKIPTLVGNKISFFGTDCDLITVACLLLFMGAMGKSAQLGLHTWLPDAMEGPTPVSALIHAATMVTAGVFMVARCSPIFEYSTTALAVVTCVGAFTCFFAASVALVQNDIKKVIAYSTCSQLGYMFFACGISAYSAGIFHLATHGFFKALLFLGAGSVIHAMSDEQDIRRMGGIWKKIPFTYIMMWIGSLALAGIYPFAGFYSKDTILEASMASDALFSKSAFMLGLLAAVMTAFYSWRLIIMVFHGRSNASKDVLAHVHESPFSMTIPLFLLAIGSVFAGAYGVHQLGIIDHELAFWNNSIFVLKEHNSLANIENIDHIFAYLPLVAAVLGIACAYFLYVLKTRIPEFLSDRFKFTYKFLSHKWYFDEIYQTAFVNSSKASGDYLWRKIDSKFIDGMPNGLSSITYVFARLTSMFQSGKISQYASVMLVGLLLFLIWTIFFMA